MLLGVDVGGTFTDAVLVDGGRLITAKAPTTPQDQSRGVLDAVHAALEAAGGRSAADVVAFSHGMTVATNALLEGAGARTVLCATEGFTDIIELGRQARPELYRLCADRPAPLVPPDRRIAVPERMGPDGVLKELTGEDAAAVAERVAALEPEAVAVVLLHAYRHPAHERLLGDALRARLGDAVHVSLSHEVTATFREFERAATTEVDAALSPLLASYLRGLVAGAAGDGLPEPAIMQSSGGLTSVGDAADHAALTVLSGPAGGAAAAALLAARLDEPDLLCFDMGGTSCDVCVVESGRVRASAGREIGGRPLALPMVDIHTVGAGGGSIAWRDAGGALRVGPRSAGADPGPACYGRGGTEPTVTDANVVLGHLDVERPLAGGVTLDAEAAERAVAALARELGLPDARACAEGIVQVANTEMVRALRVVTVERGIDPRRFALLAFGGAGPLHAAAIADELGITRIVVPRAAGVLSALGLAAAERRRDEAHSVLLHGEALTDEALRALADGADEVTWDARYTGQSHELSLRDVAPDAAALREAFATAHEERYGYRDDSAEVELVTVRTARVEPGPEIAWETEQPKDDEIVGPTVVALPEATLVVPAGWHGRTDATGTVILERIAERGPDRDGAPADADSPVPLDPIALQVATGALRAACEEMGAVLVRSAHSANIKERRDCSTALFDAHGEMVMQAEHIPVHLGAMPAAVEAVLHEDHAEGRSWILNDPYRGGTHLPDITVVTPVLAGDGTLLGFSASRAHHADVGGRVPGSMPFDSRTLDEEGVVIAPRLLDDQAIDELAQQMRQPAERRADLRAQLAANRLGATRMRELAQRLGTGGLRDACAAVLDYAERRTRACLSDLPDGTRHAVDVLEGVDGDLELRVAATVDGDRLILDFGGSAAQDPGNLNCPLAVTRSACLFAVRVLTDADIPPSAGAHRPVEVITEHGTLLDAAPPAAVAAGNVETSSRVADLVLSAFGRACGQGTMNNLTLGSDEFSYYETLGGGQGACPDADGPSAVHVAMSNTLNTPVEALELEFPLRVTQYAVRRGSGGEGAFHGGDGVIREVQALTDMSFSLITERRRHAPPGAEGGEHGARGRNLLDGEALPAKAGGTLRAGRRLRLDTPGGGGHGKAGRSSR
jgi:N-methylhydantoinase A/oxoprolinase/acetone carboxylase beta subunit/N-methylhydantoinase B/oxoprolinase/acetone carboxylase alpha subunit